MSAMYSIKIRNFDLFKAFDYDNIIRLCLKASPRILRSIKVSQLGASIRVIPHVNLISPGYLIKYIFMTRSIKNKVLSI